MRITDLLRPQSIRLQAAEAHRDAVLEALIGLQAAGGHLADEGAYRAAILAREAQGTTAIEAGIAVPHAKTDAVESPGLAAMTLARGVDWGALDGAPSDLFFMIASPPQGNVHLEILSRLMVLLMDRSFADRLRAARTPEEFLEAIDWAEAEKYGAPASEAAPRAAAGPRVLAVTACPTGIAHTYMAAEALEKAGRQLGIPVKVETNGSGGVKNALTAAEIAAADGIIVAADKKVDTDRFDAKPVLFVPVADGIHKAAALVQRAAAGDAPIHRSAGGAPQDAPAGEGLARRTYKDLMNGVSHMLPFVIGGGILIALAFLLDTFDPSDPANFGMGTPVAAFFKTVGNAAFRFMLPVLAGYIAMSIADRPGLVAGFVGGSLAASGISFATVTGGADPVASGFLGALLAGFAGGYFMLAVKKLCERLPRSLEGIKPILLYPVTGVLFMGLFVCAVGPFVGALNHGLINFLESLGGASKILLGAVLGGMMSIDMGGPFNKAAYVTGTGAIATALEAGLGQGAIEYRMMASVMVGGMVAPIAIALCTTFFKSKFTPEERKSGPVNYIMGLCFITEGAIPFAAADPLRVIPSCVAGSAVAGALSMAFGCGLMAPHGGVFVFPVVTHVAGYAASLAAGSAVGMALLAALKKERAA